MRPKKKLMNGQREPDFEISYINLKRRSNIFGRLFLMD